jgi:hypothetical protein
VDGIFAGRYRVRVWCCDWEETRSPRSKIIESEESNRGSCSACSQSRPSTSKRAFTRDHMRGALTLAAAYAVPLTC